STTRSARVELNPSVEYLQINSVELSNVYSSFARLGKLLTSEAASFDPRIEAILDNVRGLFFAAASWLSLPNSERLATYQISSQQLKSDVDYIERYLGSESASTLNKFIEDIQFFLTACRDSHCTPKAKAICDVATEQERAGVRSVFVTGSLQS